MLRLGLILGLLAVGTPLAAATVFLKPAEALKLHFKDSESVVPERKSLTPLQRREVERRIGSGVERVEWTFYVAKTGSRTDGYAVMDHEIGRMEPITFMTFLDPGGAVRSIEILVYRETQGSEVRERKFLAQFDGKRLDQTLKVGQDIRNISGATLSARAVTLGVRRALAVWDVLYRGGHL
jgi:Na+-translocating ferredoxin:NAD+ oxidoreductase RnfG subunit